SCRECEWVRSRRWPAAVVYRALEKPNRGAWLAPPAQPPQRERRMPISACAGSLDGRHSRFVGEHLSHHRAELGIGEQALLLERKFFYACDHLHGFFIVGVDSNSFERRFDGIDSASLPQDHFGGRLTDDIPMEGEKLRGAILAAVLPPACDDAGLDLEQLLADHGPVARDFVPGKLLDQARETIELVVLQAGVDAVESEQRHGCFFHRHVAGALA